MRKVEVVLATVPLLEKFFRQAVRKMDHLECFLAVGMDAYNAARQGFLESRLCWFVLYNGEPVIIFGIDSSPRSPSIGVPWLLATDELLYNKAVRRTVLKRGKAFVDEMQAMYPRLENYVYYENREARKWLAYLGFTVAEPKPYGFMQKPFCFFWKDGG